MRTLAIKANWIQRSFSICLIVFLLNSITIQVFFSQSNSTNPIPDKYRSVHWGLDEGLSHGILYSMLKDVNGFLWISTPFGLNRFDGSSFKKYFADKSKKNKTIIGNDVQGLKEDSLHNIWIGTDKGLSIYIIRADTFRNISSDLPGNLIPFWATREEVFCWDYPEHQWAAFNIHTFAKRSLARFKDTDTVGFSITNQYAIFETGSNSVWMEKGFREVGGGLLQVSLADGTRTEYNWPCYRKIPNHSHFSEGMRYDHKRNSIWISSPDGLMEFALDDKKFHHLDALNEIVNQKDFFQNAGIDIDPLGRVWVGTHPTGIIIYDPANNSVTRPFPYDPIQQKNISDANMSLYCDKDGMVWSGFYFKKGLYQLIPFSPAVKHYVADAGQANGLASSSIFNIINADQGTVWMGSPSGINIFNPHTGVFNFFSEKDLPGRKGNQGGWLVPFNVDTISKKAWIFGDGFFEMDLTSRKCSPVLYEDSNGNRVPLFPLLAHHPDNISFQAYQNGCIIGASLADHQEILVVKADDPVARKILSFPGEPIHLFRIFTNDDNLIFLRRPNDATNLTYAYHNNTWVCRATPADSIPWNGIFYNKTDKTYWINAETRLIQYDQNFRLIHSYTTEDGMPGVQIHGLIPDKKQNIWFTTDRSIFQLNTKTGTITMLAEKDGFLPQNFDLLRGTKDDAGDLYIPGEAGFYRINPDKYIFSASAVYFESLKINQKTFPLSASINLMEELSLKYFENNIIIETGTIDYYSKGKGHIRYKMEAEGKKTDWQYAPAYYTIQYEGLPPGKYKLMTQSSNAANEFNGPEKILFINISLPFWSTWWFRVLVALLGLSSIYSFTLYRSRNLQARNIQLEKKITERTSELNNSLIELKTTQDQLIQSEKMASLGELTSGIAHEIKNPLNFINNFSEINVELISEIEEEQLPALVEPQQTQMTQIIKNLKKNSEKINHHGRRVDDIVKGMLQHSRLGNINKETIDINALCEESMKLAYHGYRSKERTFNAIYETRLEPDLPKVKCVPQDLGRVILNIINNAFYAVHDKQKLLQTEPVADKLEIDSIYKPSLILTTRKIDYKAQGGVSITISDNGMGIPPNIISKIFQPFFTTKPTGEGTGLGLSMAYDIITKGHGGELKVKSKEGLGTDFEIILPVTEPQS